MSTPDSRSAELIDRPLPARGPTGAPVPRQRPGSDLGLHSECVVIAGPPARATRPAGRRVLARLLTGHGLTTAAQTTTGLAAGAYTLQQTGSASWAGVTVAVGVLPYVVLSGLAGLLADLHPRGAVLAWSCLARAMLTGGAAALMLLGAPTGWLVVLTALTAVAATPAYPALAAAVPQCLPDAELERGNALATGVENLSWLAGPGLFGLLTLGGADLWGVALGAAGVSGAAALLVRPVRLPRPASPEARTGWRQEAGAGLRLVAARRRLRAAMGLAMVDNFLYGYLVVTLVLLGHEDQGQGVLPTALTLGALLAVVTTARLARGLTADRTVVGGLAAFAGALVVVGLAVGASGTVRAWVAVAAVLVAGAATLAAEIAAVTLLQRDSEPALLARVFGVYDQLNVGAIAAGSALAGPVAHLVGAGVGLAGVATLAVGAALLLAQGLRPDGRTAP